MISGRWGSGTAAAVVAALTMAVTLAAAGPAAAADAHPAGAALLDRYVEVTGGKAAYDSVQTRILRATLELPAMNIKMGLTQYQARPNKTYVVVESQIVGKIESGVTGTVAWETSTMTGPRLLEGTEEQETMRNAIFDGTENWRRTYPKAETVGADTVDGRPCWKVVLTPRFGRTRTNWFDQETGLIRQSELVSESPAGTIQTVIRPSEYKKVGGLLLPHRAETTVLSQKRVLTIHSIELNAALPADRFAPPADVQKLIDVKVKK